MTRLSNSTPETKLFLDIFDDDVIPAVKNHLKDIYDLGCSRNIVLYLDDKVDRDIALTYAKSIRHKNKRLSSNIVLELDKYKNNKGGRK